MPGGYGTASWIEIFLLRWRKIRENTGNRKIFGSESLATSLMYIINDIHYVRQLMQTCHVLVTLTHRQTVLLYLLNIHEQITPIHWSITAFVTKIDSTIVKCSPCRVVFSPPKPYIFIHRGRSSQQRYFLCNRYNKTNTTWFLSGK